MTKDQFLASAEGQALQNLFIVTLHVIMAENDYKEDFAARRQFLEERRFQDQKRFQAGQDFESGARQEVR